MIRFQMKCCISFNLSIYWKREKKCSTDAKYNFESKRGFYISKCHNCFANLSLTNCSGERSFSRMALIKNKLITTMSQDRLNSLAIMSIESEILDYSDEFANGNQGLKPASGTAKKLKQSIPKCRPFWHGPSQ